MHIILYFAGEGFSHFPLSTKLRSAMKETKTEDGEWHLTKYGLRLAAQETRFNSQPDGFPLIMVTVSGGDGCGGCHDAT